MFINGSDEIDKLYLPAHSNHRHNVHKQLCYICTRCYRGVTRSGATRSLKYRGGIYSRGEGYHIQCLVIKSSEIVGSGFCVYLYFVTQDNVHSHINRIHFNANFHHPPHPWHLSTYLKRTPVPRPFLHYADKCFCIFAN